MESRNIYSILFNNYMVCRGFSDFFGDLLDKLDVPNCEMAVNVGLAYYKAFAQLEKKYGSVWTTMDLSKKYVLVIEQKKFIPESFEGHSRRLSYICDPKYGIDGLYYGDSTFDNDIARNYYNHLVMTSDEVLNSIKQFKFDISADELFYSSSVKEFNDKLNIMLNRLVSDDASKKQFKDIVFDLLKMVKKLDALFYEDLKISIIL